MAGTLLTLCAIACAEAPAPRADHGRVLLIGIDGATFRIAGPLLEEGRLPHLQQLAGAGVAEPLRSHLPLHSPRIWASIATGKHPAKHGILGFAKKMPGGEKQLYSSGDRRSHALWNIASDVGLSAVVVNWWNTYPVEKIRGVLVSDHLLPLEVLGLGALTGIEVPKGGPIVFPPDWGARVIGWRDDATPLTDIRNPFRQADLFTGPSAQQLSSRYRNDEAVTRIALSLERELEPDLMLVFLPGIDRVSHVLWGTLDPPSLPDAPPEQNAARARRAEALRRYYEFTDALIGRLLARYGDSDLTMVVSDHGFEAGEEGSIVSGVHASERARDGVLFARGPGIRRPQAPRPISVNDVTPTILAWLGLPVAADMDGNAGAILSERTSGRIASYDGPIIERLGSGPSGAEEEIFEQLEALGYFESGTPAKAD